LPDVAYYYTTAGQSIDLFETGLPPGTVLNTRALSREEARRLYDLPEDQDVVCLAIDLHLLRKLGYPPPQVESRKADGTSD
jgi:hypothetical protein